MVTVALTRQQKTVNRALILTLVTSVMSFNTLNKEVATPDTYMVSFFFRFCAGPR